MSEPTDINEYRRAKDGVEDDIDLCLDIAAEVAVRNGLSLSEFTRLAAEVYQRWERAVLREKLRTRR